MDTTHALLAGMDWSPLTLSLKVAAWATCVALVLSLIHI